MRRADFIFCIGFDGASAIVDGRLMRRYGKLSALQLAEAGLYKQAISASLFDRDQGSLEGILAAYNRRAAKPLSSVEELERVYGVTGVPDGVVRITIV
jgi:hypothetical protein